VRRGFGDRNSDAQKYSDTWFLVLWAGLVFAFFSLSGSKLATYILPAMPPLAILCGRYFADVWKRSVSRAASYPYWMMPVAALLIGLALVLARWFVSDNQKVLDIYNMLGPGLFPAVAGGLAIAAVPFVLKRWRGNRYGIVALLFMAALTVLSSDIVMDEVDVTRTVKPLATEINRLAKPGDEVVSYLDYFQDLPDYLGHTVTVAGWKGELEFGSEQEDTSGWMIDEPEVASRLRHKTLYIVTRDRNIGRLKALSPVPLHVIMRSSRDVLVTNASSPT